MLRYRLISAFVVICCALIFVALDTWAAPANCPGFWMVPLGAYLYFGSALECTWMVKGSRYGSITAPALLGCGGVMLAATVPVYWPLSGAAYPSDCLLGALGWPLAASVIALAGCFCWFLPAFKPESGTWIRAILAGWVAVYFGICFAFAIALRSTGSANWGMYLLVGMIVVTKFSDAGAYFIGRALGKTKLCPHVSPGKTVEGLLGGIATGILFCWIYFGLAAAWVFQSGSVSAGPLAIVALGSLLTLAGVLGDLLESVFKRELGCKDSGRLLPGLGGLWDVTDSLLPALVIGYLVVATDIIHGPGQ